MSDEKKSEYFEFNLSFLKLNKIRRNPWILTSVILAILLIVFFFTGFGNSGNVASEDVVRKNVEGFILAQTGESASVASMERDGELFSVIVDFQGQQVPVYVTLDGKYLVSDVIPLDAELTGGNELPAQNEKVLVEAGDSPVKGDANAPVEIIEFSDYECPFCGKFYTETLPLIEENYVKTGKVKLVFKDFPLNFHPNAQKAAEAARCARDQGGDEAYFKMHDKLFDNQASLSEANYKVWAKELGLDSAKFDICLMSDKFAGAVQEDLAYGQQVGVSGTPGFFINGVKVEGAQPYSVFERVIESALNGQ